LLINDLINDGCFLRDLAVNWQIEATD